MTKHLKKIIVSIMLVLCVNFITPTYSHAIDPGGILLKPLLAFPLSVCDTAATWMTIFIGWTSNGAVDWIGDNIGDIIDALSDKSTYNEFRVDPNNEDSDITLLSGASGVVKGIADGSIVQFGVSTIASFLICMEDFFLGNVELTNINIFDGNNNTTAIVGSIRQVVADWYYALRNLAGLGLLCGLIYIAIRILLSSVADEKAHYKEMLFDWFKAACLVVFVHVLMILILNVCSFVVDMLNNSTQRYGMLAYVRGCLAASWDSNQIGYLILYAMLIYYTFIFGIAYIKRFFYTMLLIVIAPIVSLLYVFGQYGKGVFDRWLKEFTSTAFLQPYHLLIYSILFGWVASLLDTGKNDIFIVILALIVTHFIKDAEKYYRMIFGIKGFATDKGQFESGEKTVKDIQRKVTDATKAVVSVAGAFIAKGGLVAGAATKATSAAAKGARGAADGFAETAEKIRTRNNGRGLPGPEESSGGVPTRPKDNGPILPDNGNTPLDSGNNDGIGTTNANGGTLPNGNEARTNPVIESNQINAQRIETKNESDMSVNKIDSADKVQLNTNYAETPELDVNGNTDSNSNAANIQIGSANVDVGNAQLNGQSVNMDLSLDKGAIDGAINNMKTGGSGAGTINPTQGFKEMSAENQHKAEALGQLGKSLGMGNAASNIYTAHEQSKQFKPSSEMSTKEKLEKRIIQADMLLNGDDQSRTSKEKTTREAKSDRPHDEVEHQQSHDTTLSIDSRGLGKEIEKALDKGSNNTSKQKLEVDAKMVGETVSKEISTTQPSSGARSSSARTADAAESSAQVQSSKKSAPKIAEGGTESTSQKRMNSASSNGENNKKE